MGPAGNVWTTAPWRRGNIALLRGGSYHSLAPVRSLRARQRRSARTPLTGNRHPPRPRHPTHPSGHTGCERSRFVNIAFVLLTHNPNEPADIERSVASLADGLRAWATTRCRGSRTRHHGR